MKRLTHYTLLLAMVAMSLLSGCKSQKNLTPTEAPTPKEEVKKKSVAQLAIEAQPDFQSVYAAKARFDLSYQRKQIGANGSITLIKDSICIISLQPVLGIELFRLEATPAEVLVIDKMNRRYVKVNYAELQQSTGLPLSFADLQNVLMARMVVVGQPQSVLYGPEAKFEEDKAKQLTSVSLTQGKVNYRYDLDNTNLSLQHATYTINGRGGEANVSYAGHVLYGTFLFPNAVTVTYLDSRYDVSCKLSLPTLQFDQPVNATRANIRSYKQTTLSTILK